MNVYVVRNSLQQVRRTVVTLALAAGAFFYLVLLSSASFMTDRYKAFFQKPPKAMEAFLGGSADLFTPAGWLATTVSHPITLALFIAAALSVAASAVATEVERGTIDLVLSRPVGRRAFLTGKAVAMVVAVTVVHVGAVAGVLVARFTVNRVDELSLASIGRMFVGSWLLFVALGLVATLVSARSSLRGRAIATTIGLIVGWFFLNFIALLFDQVSAMRYASPFHYFRPADVIAGEPALFDFGVLAATGLAATAAAIWWFSRRDLTH